MRRMSAAVMTAVGLVALAAAIPSTPARAEPDAELRDLVTRHVQPMLLAARRHGGRAPHRRPHRVLQLRHGRRRAQAADDLGFAVQPRFGRQGVHLHPAGAGGQAGRGRARRPGRQIRDRAAAGRRHPQGHARPAREPHLRPPSHAAAIRAVAPRAVLAARLHPLSQCLEGGRRARARQAGHLFQHRLRAAAAGAAAPLRHADTRSSWSSACWRRSA